MLHLKHHAKFSPVTSCQFLILDSFVNGVLFFSHKLIFCTFILFAFSSSLGLCSLKKKIISNNSDYLMFSGWRCYSHFLTSVAFVRILGQRLFVGELDCSN